MKKIKLNTAKLQFNREKITALSNQEMQLAAGGDGTIGNCVPITAGCPSLVCVTDTCVTQIPQYCCDRLSGCDPALSGM